MEELFLDGTDFFYLLSMDDEESQCWIKEKKNKNMKISHLYVFFGEMSI